MFRHKNIRLPAADYLGCRLYFITICCFQRRPAFADHTLSLGLIEILRSESAARDFGIHAYCIMPDHLHFLAEGLSESSNLLGFVLTLKLKSSRLYLKKASQPLWQKKYFDYVLRASDSPERIAWYVWMNPVRKNLCTDPNSYPFSGSFTSRIPRPVSFYVWEPP